MPKQLKSISKGEIFMKDSVSFGRDGKEIVLDFNHLELKDLESLKSVINREKVEATWLINPFDSIKLSKEIIKFCLEHDFPVNVVTKKKVPKWAINLLLENSKNEIYMTLNTINDEKWKKENRSRKVDLPETLIHSSIEAFNNGIHITLVITHSDFSITTELDWLQVINAMRNWVYSVVFVEKNTNHKIDTKTVNRIKKFVEGNKLKFMYKKEQ